MSCKFTVVPHASAPLPGKRKQRTNVERTVSQAGWKSALNAARSMRDATVFLSCPAGSITLARSYDYSVKLTSDVRAASKPLAGRRRR